MSTYSELTSLLPRPPPRPRPKLQLARTLAPFLLLQAAVGCCASLQATFYPIEAASKGASPAQFGAVFGIIHLSLFTFGKITTVRNRRYYCNYCIDIIMLAGPLVGKYLSVWGVRLIYPAGFLLDGLSFVVFGLLHWVQDTTTFLVLSYLIRIVEGVGAAATWNSNLSILMAKFPERKASVKAWCDAAFNLGLTLGPVLGAAMYEAGGFCLPFAVTGAAIIASGAAAYLVTELPTIAPTEASQSVLSLAARPAVTVALLTATVAAYTIGTVEATLSTFLEASVAQVTVRTIAAAFLTMSLASVAATPLSGWLCDTRLCPWLVSCGGCLLMLACFTLLGPGNNIFIDIKTFVFYLTHWCCQPRTSPRCSARPPWPRSR